jgi:cytochrome o ubiquinol oxidase operon protein cyoD
MSTAAATKRPIQKQTTSKLGTYVTGYLLSLYLTFTAYLLVTHHAFDNAFMITVLTILAVMQFFVQLVYFLHLSAERHARWRLFVFGLMVMVVGILVGGSIWIMNNLNYRMTPAQINNYMNSQDSL